MGTGGGVRGVVMCSGQGVGATCDEGDVEGKRQGRERQQLIIVEAVIAL